MFQESKWVVNLFLANCYAFVIAFFLSVQNVELIKPFCLWSWDSDNFYPFQFVTYQFIHFSFFHFLSNNLVLLLLAPTVERAVGSINLLVSYLVCGIFAGFLHNTMSVGMFALVGSSGSIWGIAMMFVALPQENTVAQKVTDLRIKYLIGFLFLLELFMSVNSFDETVSHWGHIGGGLTGLTLVGIHKYFE